MLAAPAGAMHQGEETQHLSDRFENWEDWDSTIPFWKHAVAGSCAGVAEHVFVFPLDTLKTHMQVLRPGNRQVTLGTAARDIFRRQGFSGFMSGVSAVAGGCIPAHAAMFTCFEYSKKCLLDESQHQPVKAAICGACATFCHDAILTPMDVVKQRMQLGCSPNISDCICQVAKQEGMFTFFRSMPTTIAMTLPFGSVLVATNESTKLFFDVDNRSGYMRMPLYFLCAGIGGAFASLVTQPFDVIKTRLQTQDCLMRGSKTCTVLCSEHPGFAATVRTVAGEGPLAFFRGVLPRMLSTIPSAAVCWGTYETVKLFLGS